MAGPGYRSRGGKVKFSKPVDLGGSESLPVTVEEGEDTDATVAALIQGLEDAGIIEFVPDEE